MTRYHLQRKWARELTSLRRRIDVIDQRLTRLLNQRATLALEVGQIKQRQGRAVFDRRRESKILRQVIQASVGPLSPDSIRLIFREILHQSRRLEVTEANAQAYRARIR